MHDGCMTRSRNACGQAVDRGGGRRPAGRRLRFVRRLIAERRIAYVKVGRHVRIAEADLVEFVAAGRVGECLMADARKRARSFRDRSPAAVWPLAGPLPARPASATRPPDVPEQGGREPLPGSGRGRPAPRAPGPIRGWLGSPSAVGGAVVADHRRSAAGDADLLRLSAATAPAAGVRGHAARADRPDDGPILAGRPARAWRSHADDHRQGVPTAAAHPQRRRRPATCPGTRR